MTNLYFKIENKESEVYKKIKNFLDSEKEMNETNMRIIKASVPEFNKFRKEVFSRSYKCTAFVFTDPDSIDKSYWKKDKYGCWSPKISTKKGKEIQDILNHQVGTNHYDAEKILDIELPTNFVGKWNFPNIAYTDGTILISIDKQYQHKFKESNDVVEITVTEFDDRWENASNFYGF